MPNRIKMEIDLLVKEEELAPLIPKDIMSCLADRIKETIVNVVSDRGLTDADLMVKMIMKRNDPSINSVVDGISHEKRLCEEHTLSTNYDLHQYLLPTVKDQTKNLTRVRALTENDYNHVLFITHDEIIYYKTGVEVSLLDLSRDTNCHMFDHADRTPFIYKEGRIENIIFSVGDGETKEYFSLPVKSFDESKFKAVVGKNHCYAADLKFMVAVGHDSASIYSDINQYTDLLKFSNLRIDLDLNVEFNRATGIMTSSGNTKLSMFNKPNVSDLPEVTKEWFSKQTASIAAYSVELYLDKEK